jgi:hypothetical protein
LSYSIGYAEGEAAREAVGELAADDLRPSRCFENTGLAGPLLDVQRERERKADQAGSEGERDAEQYVRVHFRSVPARQLRKPA